jgi:hypothetical protein
MNELIESASCKASNLCAALAHRPGLKQQHQKGTFIKKNHFKIALVKSNQSPGVMFIKELWDK